MVGDGRDRETSTLSVKSYGELYKGQASGSLKSHQESRTLIS